MSRMNAEGKGATLSARVDTDDIEALDAYADAKGMDSRSEALRRLIQQLPTADAAEGPSKEFIKTRQALKELADRHGRVRVEDAELALSTRLSLPKKVVRRTMLEPHSKRPDGIIDKVSFGMIYLKESEL